MSSHPFGTHGTGRIPGDRYPPSPAASGGVLAIFLLIGIGLAAACLHYRPDSTGALLSLGALLGCAYLGASVAHRVSDSDDWQRRWKKEITSRRSGGGDAG